MEGIINIAGTMPRIGATTVALQLVAFLKRAGCLSAYVEMNSQDYIWAAKEFYSSCVEDKTSGRVRLAGIDLYSQKHMVELTSGGSCYDYLVCDHGTLQSRCLKQEWFTETGVMVIVAGNKANEVFATEAALRNKVYHNAIYSFNFIPKEDEEELCSKMQGGNRKVLFAPYMPDPFATVMSSDAETYFYYLMCHVVDLLERGRKCQDLIQS